MTALAPTSTRTHSAVEAERPEASAAPIVAAVDDSAASRAAVADAVALAAELDAPLVFIHVRRGPAGFLGAPVYQRRLTREMSRARRVLGQALEAAAAAGVAADGEILEGSPRRRIAEFARDRGARLVVVGSRKRKLGPSVSSGVARTAGGPVIIAKGPQRLAVVGNGA